jgi:tetratricopeptide (TPR) repeat protein
MTMTSTPSSRVWLWRSLLAGAIAASGILAFVFLRPAAAPRASSEEPAPPEIDPARLDPAVARALRSAREQVLQAPASAEAWGRLGMLLRGHALADTDTLACFAQAERLDPQQPRWPYFQGLTLANTDPAAAVAKFQRTVELCGDTPDAPRLLLAEMLQVLGRLDEAAEHFRRAIQKDSSNARAHLGLARVAYQRNTLSGARTHLEDALYSAQTRKAARLLLAEIEHRQGNAAAAARELDRANALPDDAPWPDPFRQEVGELHTGKQYTLAHADRLLKAGRTREALTVLRQATEDYPETDWVWLMLGRAYLDLKDPQAAEEPLRKAIGLSAEPADAQFYLGLALFFQQKYPEATESFGQATRLRPNFGMAYFNLGQCLRQQGNRRGAADAFRSAVRCKPDHLDAHIHLAEVLIQDGRPAEALAPLRDALRLDPNNAAARKLLAQVPGAEPAGP